MAEFQGRGWTSVRCRTAGRLIRTGAGRICRRRHWPLNSNVPSAYDAERRRRPPPRRTSYSSSRACPIWWSSPSGSSRSIPSFPGRSRRRCPRGARTGRCGKTQRAVWRLRGTRRLQTGLLDARSITLEVDEVSAPYPWEMLAQSSYSIGFGFIEPKFLSLASSAPSGRPWRVRRLLSTTRCAFSWSRIPRPATSPCPRRATKRAPSSKIDRVHQALNGSWTSR